jgi:hypothetical protein
MVAKTYEIKKHLNFVMSPIFTIIASVTRNESD